MGSGYMKYIHLARQNKGGDKMREVGARFKKVSPMTFVDRFYTLLFASDIKIRAMFYSTDFSRQQAV